MSTPLTPLGAFQVIWSASTTLTALVPSGLWSGEVPEEKALPFVALLHEGEKPTTDTSEPPYIEETNLTFEVYASFDPTAPPGSPATPLAMAEKIGLAIKDAFDRATLAIANAKHVGTWRAKYKPALVSLDAKHGPNDERVGKAVIPYTVLIQRNYPR